MITKKLIALLPVAATIAMAPVADACTGMTLKAQDGAVVFGRTMEWGTFICYPGRSSCPVDSNSRVKHLPDKPA